MVAKHHVANVDVKDHDSHLHAKGAVLSLHMSSRLDQWPLKGLRSCGPASRRAEKGNSVAYNIWFTGAFNLCQYGLTSSQPNGGVKVARRSIVWTEFD